MKCKNMVKRSSNYTYLHTQASHMYTCRPSDNDQIKIIIAKITFFVRKGLLAI